MPTPLRLLLAALVLVPLAACDETGGTSSDVDVTVNDAVVARNQGDFDTAVTLLERAFESEPQNPRVRVELATTLLQRDDVDLLDIDRIGTFISETAGTAVPAPAQVARGGCAAASDPTATAFDPTDVADFDELLGAIETIARADELLDAVIPSELQGFDICTSIDDGAFVYDQPAALAALRSQGLSEAQVAQALAVNALAEFIEAYVFITEEASQQATWYRLADGSVTICVDDQDAFEAQVRSAVEGIGEAVVSLDARAAVVGSDSAAADIVEVALDAYEEVRDAIGDYCDAARS